MSFKQLMFYVGCVAVWLVLLPLFTILGAIALFAYAVFSEIVGRDKVCVDSTKAREIARLVCLGQ